MAVDFKRTYRITAAFLRRTGPRLKGMGRDLMAQLKDGEIQLVAASLSFSTILSLVPFLAVMLATFQFMGGSDILYPKVENLLLQYFKDAAGAEFTRIIKTSIRNVHAGSVGVTGALVLVVTSFRLMYDMEYGIHRVWNQPNSRPLFKRIFVYWFLMLILPIAIAIYVALTALVEIQFGKGAVPGPLSEGLALFGILYLSYRFVPDLPVNTKSALFSAMAATLSLVLVHKSFSWVVMKFFKYNKIYGGFAALPIFLIWVLTIWYVILGGVAVCASTQRRQLLEIKD